MRWVSRQRVVTVVERRQHKRFLTLRNVRNAALIALLVVAALNIRSELRDTTDGDFGRLYGREMSTVREMPPRPAGEEAVAPVPEAASADPFSLEAAAREQYLGNRSITPQPVIEASAPAVGYSPGSRTSASAVRIVGGPEGVAVVEDDAPRAPVLGGGFGRQ